MIKFSDLSELNAFAELKFNPLPNGKILDGFKLKAFADDKINVAEMVISLSDRTENIVGKGAFSPFPRKFSKALYLRVVESRDCMVKKLKKLY